MRKSKIIIYTKPDSGLDGNVIADPINLRSSTQKPPPKESELEFQIEMARLNEVMV